MNKPTPEQALQLLMQVTQAYKGTRNEHTNIQHAEDVLLELIKPVEAPKPKNAKSNK